MEKSNLDRLIERYLTGEATEEERVKLEAWLDVMKTKDGADRELTEADEERVFQQLTSRISRAEKSIASQPGYAPSLRWGMYLKFAAAFTLLVTAGYLIWFFAFGPSTGGRSFTATKDVEKFLLEDGTLVWLRKNSTLEFHSTPGSARQAILTGEGLFEVAKDPRRPFSVACGVVSINVLGTSFNLRSENRIVELKVLTGKVNVTAGNDRTAITLFPNEAVTYRGELPAERMALLPEDKRAIIQGTAYDMAFVNDAMEQITQRMEAKFDIKVAFEKEDLQRCRVTGDFTDYSLEKTLDRLSELLDLKYSITGRSVTLRGQGCP